jgi:SSS family solute:Na+ symporter
MEAGLFHLVDKVIIVVYFAAMIGIGVLLFSRMQSFDDFLVAGRRMNAPLLVCTLVSTYYGLGVLLAGSEISYESGVVNWFFDTAPAYLMILVTALVLAPKIRGRDFRSVPDIVHAHFGLPARVVTALASFIYSLPAFSIMGLGWLFRRLFDIPFEWGLILGSTVALVYTFLGGLMAVALTDAVQFVLMAVTLAVAATLGLTMVGGVAEMQRVLPDHFLITGGRPASQLLVYGLTSLSVFIEPAFYQRIIAATSRRAVVVAMMVGILLWMSYDWVITTLGIAAHTAEIQGIVSAPSSPDQAVTHFVLLMLPAGLTGLFAAGLAAAAMSTMDSYLLISSSNLIYDILNPLSGNKMSDASLLKWTRLTLVVSTAANIGICLLFGNVERLWIFITAILICTALVPVMAAFYWPNVKRRAGQAAALTGFGLVMGYYLLTGLAGAWDEAEYAYIWSGRILAWDVTLNQDYGILIILPVVIATFLAAQFLPGGERA